MEWPKSTPKSTTKSTTTTDLGTSFAYELLCHVLPPLAKAFFFLCAEFTQQFAVMPATILPVLLPPLGLVRVPARANAAGRAGVLLGIPDVPYADSYKQAELSALWGALKKCYGSEAAAREAIARNNQIMCPVYATPALLTETKAALVALVGRDEVKRRSGGPRDTCAPLPFQVTGRATIWRALSHQPLHSHLRRSR